MKHSIFILFALLFALNECSMSQEEREKSDNPFSQSKFVPDLSLILDVSCLFRDKKDDEFKNYEIPGFLHAHTDADGSHSHGEMNLKNGFNLNYGELAVSSTVDPYFDLTGIFHITTGGFEIEEGHFTTRRLPLGLQIKGGKFLSSFGRMNNQHAHYWDFANSPIVYSSLFGPHGLNEIGIHINWIAPADFYLMLAAELLRGENELSFGTEGFSDPSGSFTVEGGNGPNLITGTAKASFDADNYVILGGISGATGKNRNNHGTDTYDPDWHTVSGNTTILGADMTLKRVIDSFREITFQTEYLHRVTEGDIYYRDTENYVSKDKIRKEQSGLYSQLIYKWCKNWRIGLRYDLMTKNDIIRKSESLDNPCFMNRLTGMVEYNPTEFSRIRLQYSHDRTKYSEGIPQPYNEILLQINLSIGAHGAHTF